MSQTMELVHVKKAKASNKKAKRADLSSGLRLNNRGIQSLNKMPRYQFRQLCYPSATTMTVSGTGATYSASTGVFSASTSAVSFWSLYFRFGDLTQSTTTFGPLADQYRIDRVVVHIIPSFNVSSGASTLINLPFFTAVDYDDSSTLTAITDTFQYQNCQIHPPYKNVAINLKPRIAVPTGTGFANRPSEWIDMADQTVQHYGLKGSHGVQTGGASFTFVVEYFISIRSVR